MARSIEGTLYRLFESLFPYTKMDGGEFSENGHILALVYEI